MSIRKNEIPILEFDDNPMAVINPTHENQNISLPPKCVFAFVGGYIDVYAQEHHAQKVAEFVSATKEYPVYVLEDAGEEMVLCQAPVGAAPAVQLLDWLIGYGVRKLFPQDPAARLYHFRKARFLFRTKPCVMKGLPTIMQHLRVLWKSVRRQEKQ